MLDTIHNKWKIINSQSFVLKVLKHFIGHGKITTLCHYLSDTLEQIKSPHKFKELQMIQGKTYELKKMKLRSF